MPIPLFHPKPVAPGAFNGKPLPLAKASILSQVIFQWVAPIMSVSPYHSHRRTLTLVGWVHETFRGRW